MKKKKTVFFCNNCGYESPAWLGKCPGCFEWNTFVEEKINDIIVNESKISQKPLQLKEISYDVKDRKKSGINELDRVLGGGFVDGSMILIGGEPGIGKSTLLLQLIEKTSYSKVLYVSGEESLSQIKMRASRLDVKADHIWMLAETDIERIEETVKEEKPSLLLIDSIQTVFCKALSSAPGSVSQVREATSRMMRIAKEMGVTVVIVGHVTKDGAIAGPRVLEHMVDTVLYFEGDRNMAYRILRAVKNRFGSTNEIGVFEMCSSGLVEVENPSLLMLDGRPIHSSGSVVVPTMEGTRPMLIEIQALMADSNLGMPRRTTTGVDANRISLLLAVLDKKVGLRISSMDAFVNVLGGIKVSEPACDLGLVCALASSFKNKPIDPKTIVVGEVGLTSEIRRVNHIEKRINEASRMGFESILIPKGNLPKLFKPSIKILEAKDIKTALSILF